MRVDEDREDRRKFVLGVVLADRDPLAGGRLRLLDVRRHHLPLTLVAVEDDVALGFHVDPPEPVHAEGVLDAVVVLGRGHQPHHVRAAENQRLTVPPALHRPTLRSTRAHVQPRPLATRAGTGRDAAARARVGAAPAPARRSAPASPRRPGDAIPPRARSRRAPPPPPALPQPDRTPSAAGAPPRARECPGDAPEAAATRPY